VNDKDPAAKFHLFLNMPITYTRSMIY